MQGNVSVGMFYIVSVLASCSLQCIINQRPRCPNPKLYRIGPGSLLTTAAAEP